MVKLEEKADTTISLLIEGNSGEGKTFIAAQAAVITALNDAKVIYADGEGKAVDEIMFAMKMHNVTELKNLELLTFTDWTSMTSQIKKDCDLLIYDPVNQAHEYAMFYTADMKGIKPTERVDWNIYPDIYRLQILFMHELEAAMMSGTDVIATLDPSMGKAEGKPKRTQNNLQGSFKTRIILNRTKGQFKGTVDKDAGHPDNCNKEITDIHKWIVRRFSEKYKRRQENEANKT